MIKVRAKTYCENCPCFEAETNKIFQDDVYITYINCEHALLCDSIEEYLLKEMEKKNDQN